MNDLDPARAVTAGDLARTLHQLHIRAGMPTLRALEQRSGKTAGTPLPGTQLRSVRLGRTTLHDVLNGRKFPKKAFLLTFVAACGIDLETDRRWEEAWNQLAPQYPGQDTSQEADLRREIAELRARAVQAEAEAGHLRREIAEIRARAEAKQSSQPAALPVAHSGQAGPARGQYPVLGKLRERDPERIGPYVTLGRLGAGAMGQVYLARSTAGRLVAVKTIRIEFAEEAGFRDHFAHEVAAARRVSGMSTAAVVAADPEADVPWMATAYVPAPSLRQLVRTCGPQPVTAVQWIAAGCAEAVASIHAAGLVHRDLKPSNILVAADGPRVIDFGVAQAAGRIHLTAGSGAVGTPAYVAPEQVRDTDEASMASDVYALGATLLFAATGHGPYQGDTVMDVLVRLATEPPDLSGLPAELDGLITACLERSPRNRPTSAALLEQLGPYVEAPGLSAGDGPPFLTGSSAEMISEYQRQPPQLAPRAWGDDDSPAEGSMTWLPKKPR